MATPRATVLRTAGTNCDQETVHAFQLAGADTRLVHLNDLIGSSDPFAGSQILALPGGFTYGDDIAAGKLLAVELMHSLRDQLLTFIMRGGLIIGICNGFQVLVKTGLLPDARFLDATSRRLTLTHNSSGKFEARWVRLKAPYHTVCVFATPGEDLELPVAHGEGRLSVRSASVARELVDNGQVVYRYASQRGDVPNYPEDPNGSVDNIAAVCDRSGKIFGLMPHPERHLYYYQHPRWTREAVPADSEGAGLKLFRRAVDYLRQA
jgi:phosphoribosylformylglycinamidine synthase